MIDNYSSCISRLRTDSIGDILTSFSDDRDENAAGFKDKDQVKIAGIISSKRTRITKNGSTMAFITLEDRYAEIEVIVFAKQYNAYSSEIFTDNAVYIEGNISVEEGDEPRILLSSLAPLSQNNSIENLKQNYTENDKPRDEQRIFIRVPKLDDSRISLIYRIAALNRGSSGIVLFDESTRKYSSLKNITASTGEKVISKLSEIFGKDNVILK
jgi:DNA polymerase-3 subunit alpha